MRAAGYPSPDVPEGGIAETIPPVPMRECYSWLLLSSNWVVREFLSAAAIARLLKSWLLSVRSAWDWMARARSAVIRTEVRELLVPRSKLLRLSRDPFCSLPRPSIPRLMVPPLCWLVRIVSERSLWGSHCRNFWNDSSGINLASLAHPFCGVRTKQHDSFWSQHIPVFGATLLAMVSILRCDHAQCPFHRHG